MMYGPYQRYAIYYVPVRDTALARFGNTWLGRDPETGKDLTRPRLRGITETVLKDSTSSPARYGFHGTLKPPFFLADGTMLDDLDQALRDFVTTRHMVTMAPLSLSSIGDFLVLKPGRDCRGMENPLGQFAADIVKTFDTFRAPPSDRELARRRAAGLNARQEELLSAFGYPWVMEEFRFHLTLSNRLDSNVRGQLLAALLSEDTMLPDSILQDPFRVEEIGLFGDPGNGENFKLLQRYRLQQ